MNSTLGEDMNIGLFVTTRSLKFRIVFNDISRDDLLRFSAKGTAREELETLIRFIQKAPLDFDTCVTIRRERIEKATLGESGCILGVDTWIGSVKDEQAITL
jgi:type VI secretion system protein ImpH